MLSLGLGQRYHLLDCLELAACLCRGLDSTYDAHEILVDLLVHFHFEGAAVLLDHVVEAGEADFVVS